MRGEVEADETYIGGKARFMHAHKRAAKIELTRAGVFMTHALHISNEKCDLVGIGALRVLIVSDGDLWYAQGIDIDYGATGATTDEVKNNFAVGLDRTIELHLEKRGTIEGLLKFAPASEWQKLLGGQAYRFDATIVYEVPTVSDKTPFRSIAYLQAA